MSKIISFFLITVLFHALLQKISNYSNLQTLIAVKAIIINQPNYALFVKWDVHNV